MFIGETINSKGSTSDSTYFYFGNIDISKIGPGHHSLGNNPFSIYVAEKEFTLNKGLYRKDALKHNNVYLPFRYPMMVVYSALFAHPTLGSYYFPGAISACNSDFGLNIGTDDTPSLGHYNELTIDRPGFDKLFMDVKWGHIYPALYSKNVTDTPRDVAYYEGNPIKLVSYPTTAQLYSVTDGELYVVYNNKTKLIAQCENERITRDFGTSSSVNFHHRTYKEAPIITINSAYNAQIELAWETPVIAHYTYDGNTFVIDGAGYPFADYTNKIDSSKSGSYSWNTKVMPYQNVPASDGTNFLIPSRNRCFMDSLYDEDNNRLVVVYAYETANNSANDPSTEPDTFKLYVSYFDTSSSLTFVPDSGPVNRSLSDITPIPIDNVHKVSITKYDRHYIIAVSTDTITNNVVKMNTLLLKVASDATLSSSAIETLTVSTNSGFGEVLGYTGKEEPTLWEAP